MKRNIQLYTYKEGVYTKVGEYKNYSSPVYLNKLKELSNYYKSEEIITFENNFINRQMDKLQDGI